MDRTCVMLEKTCKLVRGALDWLSRLDAAPVAYIAEDRTRVATGRRPLLEFGLHARGSEARVRVGKQCLVSRPGTLLVMNAHYGNFGEPRKSWGFWCLSLDVDRSAPWPGVGRSPLLAGAALHNPGAVASCYEAVAREYARPGPGQTARLKGAVLSLLGEALDGLAAGEDGPHRYSPPVETAIGFIHNELRNPALTLAAVARRTHLSEDHFGRLFRSEVGVSPMQYLRDARLQRARQLLHRTRLTVSEIAYEVGFRDPAYFSRVFKACTDGLSPREFRRSGGEPPDVGRPRGQR